ncbi:type II toxin-antitoxin system VapC family toxin [Candidatus Daviesbacteria bacterium]|nr:type II toxin-antitoxin system VapC family toxin [Candidatus Daviesbacteria bacterium]
MNYLLDTHAFIWSLISPGKLSLKTKAIIKSKDNVSWVSAITFWEISLKYEIGKLDLKGTKPDELYKYATSAGFEIEDLQAETAATFYKLRRLRNEQSSSSNKDPFDLMLAWQAITLDYTLVTNDSGFADYKDYGLKTVW